MGPIYAMLAAVGLGALHSLEPGHGKSVISAYLIATRGKAKDALIMGILSAVAHTFSIIWLSLAASSFMHWLTPDKIAGWIQFTAGIWIALIGFGMIYRYFHPAVVVLGKWFQTEQEEVCEHHGHRHPAHDVPSSPIRLVMVALFTGMIPCPSAMAIFLASLGSGSIHAGVMLVAAFSLGGAMTMSAIGLLIVRSGTAVKRWDRAHAVRSLNLLSACFILGIGLLVLLRSAA